MEVCIPGKVAKAVAGMCSTEVNRPMLQNAVIRAGHLVATNGHVLARVPLFEDPRDEPASGAVPDYPEHTDWVVPVDALKGLKASEHLSVNLETGRVLKLKGHELVATLPDLQEGGAYPNVDAVMPKTDPVARAMFSPDYLVRVGQMAKAFGWDSVALDMTDGLVNGGGASDCARRAVAIKPSVKGADPVGLLMPMKFRD